MKPQNWKLIFLINFNVSVKYKTAIVNKLPSAAPTAIDFLNILQQKHFSKTSMD